MSEDTPKRPEQNMDAPPRDAPERASTEANQDADTLPPRDTQPPASAQSDQDLDSQATVPPGANRQNAETLPVSGSGSSTTPTQWADYELIEEIARGGMGVVYKARQAGLNRIVALKMILSGKLAGEEDIRRFYVEAEAAAQLNHPNIVPVYDVGQHEGQHYFSMAFVEGSSLGRRVESGPMSPEESAQTLRSLAEAVQYAHDRGIIHRDLKPENVLIDSAGEPQITDFGLAKQVQTESGLTATGQVMGTPSYMPPEQAAGGEVTTLADVYSLGAILYCLLTGRPPFQSASVMDTLLQVIEREPVAPHLLNAATPADLETICLKCLEKDPRRRYASAQEVADELKRFSNNEPILARPVARAEKLRRWCQRNPLTAALLSTVALLLVAGTVISSYFAYEANARANAEAAALRQAYLAIYTAQMTLISHDYDAALISKAQGRLQQTQPEHTGGEDLRGFEWYYWNQRIHGELLSIPVIPEGVRDLTYSPDGTKIAATQGDGIISVWNAETGESVTALGNGGAGSGAMVDVHFSPDGQLVAAGMYARNNGGAALVWNAATGEPKCELYGNSEVWSVDFSPDSKSLLVSKKSGEINLYDIQSGKQTLSLRDRRPDYYHVAAFSPDGQFIAAGLGKSVQIWNVETGRPHAEYTVPSLSVDTHHIADIEYSVDGRFLAAASTTFLKGAAVIWDCKSKQVVQHLRGHDADVSAVAFSSDSRQLATSSADNTAKLWDIATGDEVQTFRGHTGPVLGVAFHPGGKRLASSSQTGNVKTWEIGADPNMRTLLTAPDAVRDISLSPDDSQLAVASPRNVTLRSVQTGEITRTLSNQGSSVSYLRFSPDGQQLATIARDDTVRLWNLSNESRMLTLRSKDQVNDVSFSPTNAHLATAHSDGRLRVWDTNTGRELQVLHPFQPKAALAVTFSSDGTKLATCGVDQNLHVWDQQTGMRLMTLVGHESAVFDVQFSPDGLLLASAGQDRTIRIWNTVTQEELYAIADTSSVRTLAFSPNGQRIVSAGTDGTINVWRTADGEPLLRLTGHQNEVNRVLFASDGRTLFSASDDKTVRVWNTLDPSKPM